MNTLQIQVNTCGLAFKNKPFNKKYSRISLGGNILAWLQSQVLAPQKQAFSFCFPSNPAFLD